jgi:transcriptional regulator with XRE-family HTH domain
MQVKAVPTLGWTRGSVAATILLVTQEQRDQIAMRVRTLMAEQGHTNAALAYKAGVSEKTISRLINGKLDSRYDTIEKVAVALGLEEQELRGSAPTPLGLDAGLSQLDRIEATLEKILDRLAALEVLQGVARDEQQEQQRAPAGRRRRAA